MLGIPSLRLGKGRIGSAVVILPVRTIFNLINTSQEAGASDYNLMAKTDNRSLSTWFQGGWSDSTIGSGSFGYADDGDAEILTSTSNDGTGRYLKNKIMTLAANRRYCFSVFVHAASGDFSAGAWIQAGFTAGQISYGSLFYGAQPTPGFRYGLIFTPNVATSVTYRVGAGSLPGSSGQSISVSRAIIEDITDIDFIDDYLPPTKYGVRLNATGVMESGTAGKIITLADPNGHQNTDTSKAVRWLAVGDSFSNESTDYPGIITAGSSNYFVQSAGYAGAHIQGLPTTYLAGNLAQCDFDGLILQGGINNIMGSDSLATMQGYLEAQVAIAVTGGIATSNMIFLGVAGFHGYVSWSQPAQNVCDSWNAWLPTYAASLGAGFVDLYNLLGDVADPSYLAAAYDVGDGLHPSKPAGVAVIATEIVRLLDSKYKNGHW